MYEQTSDSPFKTAAMIPLFGNMSASHALRNKNVQKLIHSENEHFDLIINEDVYLDVFLAFAHKFRAPAVTICKRFIQKVAEKINRQNN